MFDSWLLDLRHAARLLRRSPLFALTAAASLAIGIGANTTIFTLANALLFRQPAGVLEPSRLVDIGRAQDGRGFDTSSYPTFRDVRARNGVFSNVYAYGVEPQPISLGGANGAESIFGSLVTLNYFETLGAQSSAGRLFSASDDDAPGASPLVVLSHRFWTRRFNGDRALVGSSLTLNGRSFTIVGIAEEGFQGTHRNHRRRVATADDGRAGQPTSIVVAVDEPRISVADDGGAAEAWRLGSAGTGGSHRDRVGART